MTSVTTKKKGSVAVIRINHVFALRKEFAELMEKYGSNSNTSSGTGRISPILLSTGIVIMLM